MDFRETIMNNTSHTTTKDSAASGKYLTFALSQERYGMEILKVQEIIGVTHITKVPKADSYIKGVINLRGKIIPVVDLRLRFNLEEIPYNERTCIIVVTIPRGDHKIAVGVIVDTVLEVTSFDRSTIEDAPEYGSSLDTQFILGIGKKVENELVVLIDICKVLNAEAIEVFDATPK